MQLIIILISIIIDQLSKFFIVKNLHGESIDIIKNIFSFTYVENRGAAWGIFSNNAVFLTIFSAVLILGILTYLFKFTNNKVEKITISFVAGGAISNFIDRIFRGFVVDFFDFKVWPVFNIADMFIVCGVLVFCIYALKKEY